MLRRIVTRAGDEAWSMLQLARAGLLRPLSPGQLVAILRAVRDYGELGAAVTLPPSATATLSGSSMSEER